MHQLRVVFLLMQPWECQSDLSAARQVPGVLMPVALPHVLMAARVWDDPHACASVTCDAQQVFRWSYFEISLMHGHGSLRGAQLQETSQLEQDPHRETMEIYPCVAWSQRSLRELPKTFV